MPIEVGRPPPCTGDRNETTEERDELAALREENRQLRVERDILKGRGLLREGDDMKLAYVAAEKARGELKVTELCRALRLTTSGVLRVVHAGAVDDRVDRAIETRRKLTSRHGGGPASAIRERANGWRLYRGMRQAWVVLAAAALGLTSCTDVDRVEREPRPRAADTDIARDVIGIAACDAYVRAMNECYLPTLAPADRDELLAPMKQLRLGWKAAATGSADDQTAAAAACRQQLDAHAAALAEHRCSINREEANR